MKALVAALYISVPCIASGHSLWLESSGERVRARYGEPEIQLTERSPGKLDALEVTKAAGFGKNGGTTPTPWEKEADSFVLQGVSSSADAITVEARSTQIRPAGEGKPATHTLYYARRISPALVAATRSSMTLDIVPTGEANVFAVTFKGVPLMHGTVKVIAPNFWIQVHDLDDRGHVRITTPWQGTYVLDVETREDRTGELSRQHFDAIVHRATLSFTQLAGDAVKSAVPAQFRAH